MGMKYAHDDKIVWEIETNLLHFCLTLFFLLKQTCIFAWRCFSYWNKPSVFLPDAVFPVCSVAGHWWCPRVRSAHHVLQHGELRDRPDPVSLSFWHREQQSHCETHQQSKVTSLPLFCPFFRKMVLANCFQGPLHPREWDWVGLVHNGTGHSGTGTQRGWDIMGLGHNGAGT